jgi:hypothetical protein
MTDIDMRTALDLTDTRLAARWMHLREQGRVQEAGDISERRARIARTLDWWGYWTDREREEAYELLDRCPA